MTMGPPDSSEGRHGGKIRLGQYQVATSSTAPREILCWPYGIVLQADDSLTVSESIMAYALRYIEFVSFAATFVLLVIGLVLVKFHLLAGMAFLSVAIVMALFIKAKGELPFLRSYLERGNFRLRRMILDDRGIQFHTLDPGFAVNRDGVPERVAKIHWSAITQVQLVEARNGHPDDRLVRFYGQGRQSFSVKLSAVHTRENWEAIADWLGRHSPTAFVDERIAGAFRIANDNVSFTELWLQCLESAPSESSFEPLAIGAMVGEARYRVVRKLATGGQGSAYVAMDESEQKEIVLKEYLLPVHAAQETKRQARESFKQEAELLASLSHPQIVRLQDYFIEGDRGFLVLELIDGESLDALVKRQGPFAANQIMYVLLQMCDILEYLHGQAPPVMHLDFTPQNLLLTQNKTIKLIDFTIARISGQDEKAAPAGKLAYMPPEQFRGLPTLQSDIYALGGTIYFLLTGEEPEALRQLDLRTRMPDIPDRLLQVVFKSTAQNEAERYADIRELRNDIGI